MAYPHPPHMEELFMPPSTEAQDREATILRREYEKVTHEERDVHRHHVAQQYAKAQQDALYRLECTRERHRSYQESMPHEQDH